MAILACARIADFEAANVAESLHALYAEDGQSWAEISSLMLTALSAQQRTALVNERERIDVQLDQLRQRNVELTKAREMTEQQYMERVTEMEHDRKRLCDDLDALSKRMEVMAGHTGRLAEEKTTYSAQLTNAQNVIRRLNKLFLDLGQGEELAEDDLKLLHTVCKRPIGFDSRQLSDAVNKHLSERNEVKDVIQSPEAAVPKSNLLTRKRSGKKLKQEECVPPKMETKRAHDEMVEVLLDSSPDIVHRAIPSRRVRCTNERAKIAAESKAADKAHLTSLDGKSARTATKTTGAETKSSKAAPADSKVAPAPRKARTKRAASGSSRPK